MRVRRERFGLLFYDGRAMRLFSLASGDRLEPEYFQIGLPLEEWQGESDVAREQNPLLKALTGLADKGVLVAA